MIQIDSRHLKDNIEGEITLNASKSISNRVLIIKALTNEKIQIDNLSNARDTTILDQLLSSLNASTFDAQDAGTTYRFLTALLAFRAGTQILTGTIRMKKRPIGDLVEALRSLGAQIDYLEAEGFPPIRLNTPVSCANNEVSLKADISSQYISALLMLGPTLPNGLKLTLEGSVVSQPYIMMTIQLMHQFGVDVLFVNQVLSVEPQTYSGGFIKVESDWSAASYYYAFAALAAKAHIQLNGLYQNSIQGDAVIQDISKFFGVTSVFNDNGVLLVKNDEVSPEMLEFDFVDCPDLAQTVMAMCSYKNTVGLFSSLESLKIKECNRVEAMNTELMKRGTTIIQLPEKFSKDKSKINYVVESHDIELEDILSINTYEDHRMAMANACLSLGQKIVFDDANVVDKSYPDFWDDLKKIGVFVEK